MKKSNKLLDKEIQKRFNDEKKYQPKQPTKKRRRIFEIIIGVLMFLVLISNLIMMLARYIGH